jgi:hypothetical protein
LRVPCLLGNFQATNDHEDLIAEEG